MARERKTDRVPSDRICIYIDDYPYRLSNPQLVCTTNEAPYLYNDTTRVLIYWIGPHRDAKAEEVQEPYLHLQSELQQI